MFYHNLYIIAKNKMEVYSSTNGSLGSVVKQVYFFNFEIFTMFLLNINIKLSSE